MNEQALLKRIEDLERLVDDMRQLRDVVFSQSLRRHALQNQIEAGTVDSTVGDLNDSTLIPVDSATTVDAPVTYDKRLPVTIDGVKYYIGVYTS
jgi:hypothetical protein